MVCIYCGHALNVTNSRPQVRTNQIWRRRYCGGCKAILTTHETIDYSKALVVSLISQTDKRNNLQPFIKEKLFLSIYKSCQHRAQALEDAQALSVTILSKLLKTATDGIITNELIIKHVFQTLEHFDKAAAVQYAAYHPLTKS